MACWRTLLWLLLGATALSSGLLAQKRPIAPKPGDPVRKAIFNALRPPVQKDLKQKVIFEVRHLKLQNGWAFLRGVPQQPNGKPIDYRRTRYWEAVEAGMFDDEICALLRKKAGKWRVVIYNIGATDVVYEHWDENYKAPPAIFR